MSKHGRICRNSWQLPQQCERWFSTAKRCNHLILQIVCILSIWRIVVVVLLTLGELTFGSFLPVFGKSVAWSQSGGYFTYYLEVRGLNTDRRIVCGRNPFENNSTIDIYRQLAVSEEFPDGFAHGWYLSGNIATASFNGDIKFHIYWHGPQAPPEPYFVVIDQKETAYLNVFVSLTGEATATFSGELLSATVSLSGCHDPSLPFCSASRRGNLTDRHAYILNFTRLGEELWYAVIELNNVNVRLQIDGQCPPPPLPSTSGYIEALISYLLSPGKFVYIVAENEPSYHRSADCTPEMNNASGRLDRKKGDTVVELEPHYWSWSPHPGFVYHFTDWYLGNRMTYVRRLVGPWCPGDCPLNEWEICGRDYKDNFFHEFTFVNAVIGFPNSDCGDWYLGTEVGWNNEPSPAFWYKEDVKRRLIRILEKLPFTYRVGLKVTDDYGNGFSDDADYKMIVHAPLELIRKLEEYYTYLPEEIRSRYSPTHFEPKEEWGAEQISDWVRNTNRYRETFQVQINSVRSFTNTFTSNVECSFGSERIIPDLGKLMLGMKFGLGQQVSTAQSYGIGYTFNVTLDPGWRGAIFAQRAATVEVWLGALYDRNGYVQDNRFKIQVKPCYEIIIHTERVRL